MGNYTEEFRKLNKEMKPGWRGSYALLEYHMWLRWQHRALMPLAAWHVTGGGRGVCWNAGLGVQLWKVTRSGSHTHMLPPSPRSYTGASVLLSVHKWLQHMDSLARILRCPRNPLTWQIHTNHCAPLSVDTPLLFSRGKNKQNTIQPQGTSFIPRNTPSVHFQWNIYSQSSQIEVQVLPRRAV